VSALSFEAGAEEEVGDGDLTAEQLASQALPRLQRQAADPLPAPFLPDENECAQAVDQPDLFDGRQGAQ